MARDYRWEKPISNAEWIDITVLEDATYGDNGTVKVKIRYSFNTRKHVNVTREFTGYINAREIVQAKRSAHTVITKHAERLAATLAGLA